MALRTLGDIKTAVARRYGDVDFVTCPAAEIAEYLAEGYKRVINRCYWLAASSQTISTSTGTLGSVTLTEPNVAAVLQVAILKSAGYENLQEMALTEMNDPFASTATTVESVKGFKLHGQTLFLFPILDTVAVTVRLTYNSAIGGTFPGSDGSTLPTGTPDAVEDAIIRYALSELYARDNDYEAAQFALNDFNQRVYGLVADHNRPLLGHPVLANQTDFYMLDAESAW